MVQYIYKNKLKGADDMTLNEIELMCDKLRKKYNIIVPFDDGYEIAYAMHGHVREDSLLTDEQIGSIRKYNDSFWITINPKINEHGKKIIISQLIGILCLYTPFLTNQDEWNKYPTTEIDFNNDMLLNGYFFAKELLMPKYLFYNYFCKNITATRKINMRVMANIFKLPIELVKERSLDLKLIVAKPQEVPAN